MRFCCFDRLNYWPWFLTFPSIHTLLWSHPSQCVFPSSQTWAWPRDLVWPTEWGRSDTLLVPTLDLQMLCVFRLLCLCHNQEKNPLWVVLPLHQRELLQCQSNPAHLRPATRSRASSAIKAWGRAVLAHEPANQWGSACCGVSLRLCACLLYISS